MEESIVAWRQYLETNYGADVESCDGVEGERTTSVCPKNSAEELAEQLLGEVDKAAAKVCALNIYLCISRIFLPSCSGMHGRVSIGSSLLADHEQWTVAPGCSHGTSDEKAGARRCWK
jgi:hypothetical protein